MSCSGPNGETLLVIAAAVSLQIAQGKSVDQLGIIAAFFEVLGDNLALIAARRVMQEAECKDSVTRLDQRAESV